MRGEGGTGEGEMGRATHYGEKREGKMGRGRTILDLLAVAGGLLKGLDDVGSSRGHEGDSRLAVLDGELDRDLEALPVLGGLGNIITDLLRGQTERADLRGKRRCRRNLTADRAEGDCNEQDTKSVESV